MWLSMSLIIAGYLQAFFLFVIMTVSMAEWMKMEALSSQSLQTLPEKIKKGDFPGTRIRPIYSKLNKPVSKVCPFVKYSLESLILSNCQSSLTSLWVVILSALGPGLLLKSLSAPQPKRHKIATMKRLSFNFRHSQKVQKVGFAIISFSGDF